MNADPVIDDVWSRTATRHRRRAVLLLLANMILFGALCCFMYWLRTGWHFPPTHDRYSALFQETLNPTWVLAEEVGQPQVTMHDLLMKPISPLLVPMQAVIIGLLIAALVAVPILVSLLYRFPASVPFCLMVGAIAVMPWLGANLLLCCAIASYARRRLKVRFAAALLALIPIGIYLFAAAQNPAAARDLLTPQMERGLVVVPLLMSAVAACAFIACALAIAHVVVYRPGAIASVLAVMFLAPCALFFSQVGADELYFRLLEQAHAPHFEASFTAAPSDDPTQVITQRIWARNADRPIPRAEIQRWVDRYFASDLTQGEGEPIRRAVHTLHLDYLESLALEQAGVQEECKRFLLNFPNSRYIPSVLFIKGRALDMRLDSQILHTAGVLRFYSDFPSEGSKATWQTLVENCPRSPLADIGRYRLAQLAAREGRIGDAIALLEQVCEPRLSAGAEPGAPEGLLRKQPPEAGFEAEYRDLALKADIMRSLMQCNRDPDYGDAPLVAYLSCDPRHPRYRRNLLDILERFPGSCMADNIALELVLGEQNVHVRITQLQELEARFPDGDAQPEILYALAMACRELRRPTEAARYVEQIREQYHDSSFAAASRRILPLARLAGR